LDNDNDNLNDNDNPNKYKKLKLINNTTHQLIIKLIIEIKLLLE